MYKKGFTLIELLVVIVILSVLATFVGVKYMGKAEEARKTQAKIQIDSFENALKMYKLDSGEFPSTEQGLKALVEKPAVGNVPKNWREGGYLDKNRVPKDPWGNDYNYVCPGMKNTDSFDLFSYGPSGQAGGQGNDAEIGNWEDDTQKQQSK
jgi:general secretion pathway protein G